MRVLAVLLPALAAFAQDNAPTGLLRGDLLAWNGTARAGEVVFRNIDNRVYQCSFDDKTYMERASARTTVAGIQTGDQIEVLADRRDNSGLCYARTIHVIEVKPSTAVHALRPRPRSTASSAYSPSSATDLFAPRGDLTFAGVVVRVNPAELTLRTKTNERKSIHLRPDTRYMSDGQLLSTGNLKLNTLVFIRAGRNLDNEIEAYQVMWRDAAEP